MPDALEDWWPVFEAADLTRVRWSALLPQLPQLATILLVSAISLLLIASGIETAARRDLDLKHELYLNGVANLIGGAAGSHTGYTRAGASDARPQDRFRLAPGRRRGAADRRGDLFGASLLGSVPRFLLGGMVLFLGVATLLDWPSARAARSAAPNTR